MKNILDNDKILKKLKVISKKYNLLVLVLFGSVAQKSATKNSDIDFAFYTKKEIKYEKYMKLLNEFYDILEVNKVDLVNVNSNEDPLLRYEIFIKGVCLYEKYEGLFDEIQNRVWFDYCDYKPFYKIQNEITRKNLKELEKLV